MQPFYLSQGRLWRRTAGEERVINSRTGGAMNNGNISRRDSAVSRRSFVKGSLGAGIGLAAIGGFPMILHADDKAGDKPPVLGKNAHTYELVPGWGQLPDGKKFGNTHAVCESEDGRIFIHNASPTGDATCVFDADGKFIKSWGKQFAGGAHGMDLRKEGNQEFLYLAPTGMHKAYKTTLDGEVVMTLDYPKTAVNDKGELCYQDKEITHKKKDGTEEKVVKKAEDFYVPTFTAFGPNGDFYITDGYGSNYVHRYDSKGNYMSSWGGTGNAPGKLSCPHGIWCDTREKNNPMIVVADRSNVRLQFFTLEGQFIKMVTEELRHPCHFFQRGTDLLVPDLRGRVTIFDKDNKLVTHLGDNPNPKQWANNGVPEKETTPGVFCTPHGATWDRQGNIYVVEWLPYGRVTKLRHVGAAA
jgi:hypothetical protein